MLDDVGSCPSHVSFNMEGAGVRRHVSLLLQVHYQKIGIARPKNNHVGASYYIPTVNMFQKLIFSPINQQSSEAGTFVHY